MQGVIPRKKKQHQLADANYKTSRPGSVVFHDSLKIKNASFNTNTMETIRAGFANFSLIKKDKSKDKDKDKKKKFQIKKSSKLKPDQNPVASKDEDDNLSTNSAIQQLKQKYRQSLNVISGIDINQDVDNQCISKQRSPVSVINLDKIDLERVEAGDLKEARNKLMEEFETARVDILRLKKESAILLIYADKLLARIVDKKGPNIVFSLSMMPKGADYDDLDLYDFEEDSDGFEIQ